MSGVDREHVRTGEDLAAGIVDGQHVRTREDVAAGEVDGENAAVRERFDTCVVAAALRTPLGNTLEDVVRRMRAGEAAAIANPFSSTYKLQRVAPIRSAPGRSRNERFLRRMGLYGMEVAHEAFTAAGIPAGPRYGFFVGVGGLRAHWDDMMAALADQHDSGEDAWERGLKNVHPYWMLRHLSNNVHALASAELGLRGEGATFGGEHAGAHAMRAAIRALADGAIDAALVVAYDSLLEPETLVELGERMPADFIPGEAAAAIVLRAGAQRSSNTGGADRADHADRADRADRITALMGYLGAATAVVQAIADLALGISAPADLALAGLAVADEEDA